MIPTTRNFFLLLLFHFVFFSLGFSQKSDPKKTDQKLNTAFQFIRLSYVDTVDEEKLTEAAIIAMLKELDPHSVYMTKEEIDKANEPLIGNFEGIGVQFNIIKDTIVVVTPTPDGPSEKVGVMSGDKIVQIDGEDAVGKKINTDYVVKKLRGPKGSSVKVSIYRKGLSGLMERTIIRDKIPITSLDVAYMVNKETGYIRLNKFSQSTMSEFSAALKGLKKLGLKNLILDLRDNSGGYLNTAIELSDEFLAKDNMIVYTEGKASPRQVSYATSKGEFEKGRLIVLINEGSASASEIVTGAVQDLDRGLVIGRRSFGKGLVQRPYTLPDGSVIRLTTAHYYTPSGRCVQKPYNEGVEKYYKDLSERFKHGEYIHADSIKFPDSLKYYTPNKRVVYGGGGIMPDLFVPLDTSYYSTYYSELLRKGIINQYVIKYLETNREKIKALYPSVEEFLKGYNIDENFMGKFFEFAAGEGIEKDEEGYKTSEVYMKNFFKAWIARNLWDYAAYWRVSNENDEVFLNAVKAIQDKDLFKKNNISL